MEAKIIVNHDLVPQLKVIPFILIPNEDELSTILSSYRVISASV
jgi:hypothetical protein